MAVAVFTLNFPPYTVAPTVNHRVYVKRAWADAWTYVPWLFCDQATWCCAPSIPTAILDWDVGFMNRQGRLQPAWYQPLSLGRYYVKIVANAHSGIENPGPVDPSVTIKPTLDAVPATIKWWGSFEVSQEMQEGAKVDAGVVLKTGHQKLTAFGLAQELARTQLDGHWWSPSGSPATNFYSSHPGTFNEKDAQGRISGNHNFAGGNFSDVVQVDDEFWTTRRAVEYLLQYHSPRVTAAASILNNSFSVGLSLSPGTSTILPDWDRPSIPMAGKNCWQVLNELMPRGRLLSFYLEVDDTGAFEQVYLVPVSLTDVDIDLGAGWLQANPRQWSVQHHNDRACFASLRKNTLQAVDQFIIRGARRCSIVSIGFADTPYAGSPFATLEKGWTAAQETAYEAAASGGAGYAAASVEEKQRQNAQARARDDLYQVFRRFQIPDAWSLTCKVQDGRGSGNLIDAFVDQLLVNPRELRILPTLPLKDGYDYSAISGTSVAGTPTRVSLGPHENLRPLCFFKIPDQPTRWIEASRIGQLGKEETGKKQNHRMSVRVQIPEKDKAVLLEVHGQPQHAIAFADFTLLPVDPYCGEWEWKTAVFTVALEDDRYCEGRWPADVLLMVRDTELRRSVVYAGDEYRQDWIAPHTALSVHPTTGELVECTAGGYIRTDNHALEAKARIAHAYYNRSRNVLTLSCDRPTNVIRLGDLVASCNPQAIDTVGSIVTQLTLTIPSANSSTVHEAVTFEIETAHAELDFLDDVLEKKK